MADELKGLPLDEAVPLTRACGKPVSRMAHAVPWDVNFLLTVVVCRRTLPQLDTDSRDSPQVHVDRNVQIDIAYVLHMLLGLDFAPHYDKELVMLQCED